PAKLTAPDAMTNADFGVSTAISSDGSTVVVGASQETVGGVTDRGAVYIYKKPGGVWASTSSSTAELTVSDPQFGSLGNSVAISGDGTMVASAAPGGNSAGTAYVFTQPVGGWGAGAPAEADITATGLVTNDSFGGVVALSQDGSTLAVSTSADFSGGTTHPGAYVYVKPGPAWASTASPNATLLPSNHATGDQFGTSIAFSRNGAIMAVGAAAANGGTGAAYVFSAPGGGWGNGIPTQAELTPTDAGSGGDFGFSVALSGDGKTLQVGAPFSTYGSSSGGVYGFTEPSGGWITGSEPVTTTLSTQSAEFGISVAVSDDGSTTAIGNYGNGSAY